ncbi:collagen alpha-1(I) chain-like [Canis lupus dingo]|uniref:collagen alpha-1(I) chain-like n=1 Tax=Canis lupus dingo TaxID=286419 RepID=UPI0020C4DF70|nr:collagen alpha-1(I) chain-like [Canis lupus dingo]
MASGMAWGPCGLVVGYLKVKSCFAEASSTRAASGPGSPGRPSRGGRQDGHGPPPAEHRTGRGLRGPQRDGAAEHSAAAGTRAPERGAPGWRRLRSKPAGPRRGRSRPPRHPRGTPTRSLAKAASALRAASSSLERSRRRAAEPPAAALALDPCRRQSRAPSRQGLRDAGTRAPGTRGERSLRRPRDTAARRTRGGGNVQGPAWRRAAGHGGGTCGDQRAPGLGERPRVLRRTPGSREVAAAFPRTGREDGPGTPRALGEAGQLGDTAGARGGRRGLSGIRVRPRPQVCGDRSGPGQAHAGAGAGPFRRLRLAPAPRRRPGVVGAGHAASSPGGGSGGGGAATGTSAALGRARASPGARGPEGADPGDAPALAPGPGPCFAARTRAARQGRGTRRSSHGPTHGEPRPPRSVEVRAASSQLQAAAADTATRARGATRGQDVPEPRRRPRPRPRPRGAPRAAAPGRAPAAATGGHRGRPGGRPEADGAAGRTRLGLGAQVPPPAQLEAEAACSPCPPRGEAPSCSAARPEARAPRGLRASPAAAPEPEPEPSRSRAEETSRELPSGSLKRKPASPGPGRQEAPRLPGGPPPRSASEKPPPSPAANEKPLPRSANEKPPPSPAANEKPLPRSANEKPPPSPAANEKLPPHSASRHFPACESSSPAWEAENPARRHSFLSRIYVAPSPEEAVNPVTRPKSLKAIFVGSGAPEATSKEFCSSKTVSCLLRSQFPSDVDLGFADCNPRPGFPDKTPCSGGRESQGVDPPPRPDTQAASRYRTVPVSGCT